MGEGVYGWTACHMECGTEARKEYQRQHEHTGTNEIRLTMSASKIWPQANLYVVKCHALATSMLHAVCVPTMLEKQALTAARHLASHNYSS